jgi:hypothetical protein
MANAEQNAAPAEGSSSRYDARTAIDATGGFKLPEGKAATWLDQQHPEYKRNKHKWRWAHDHYTGEVLNEGVAGVYLVRRAIAESEQAFLERLRLADFTPHFGAVVDQLAGMLFAVEASANRFTGGDATPGLGDPKDEKSAFHRLWKNTDGKGTGWLTFFKKLTIELILTHRTWVIVDQNADGKAAVRMWPSEAVPNWSYDPITGDLNEVLIVEAFDGRVSVKDDLKKIMTRWVVYNLEGWERWIKNAQGQPEMVDSKEWEVPFVNSEGRAVLPIFPVELPLDRHVGWMLAKKSNAIFNKESERDHILRTANFPILLLVGTNAQYKKAIEDIKKGLRALQQDPKNSTAHAFIAPSAESASVATEVLKRKVEEFYITAFREYGNAARQKTATEVKQDVSAGVGAFLQMLKAAVDDAENNVFFRVAQIEVPQDKSRWFTNHVERSEDFVPIDIQATIDKLKERYFPAQSAVPLGATGTVNAIKQMAQFDNLDVDEDQVTAAVMGAQLGELANLFKDLPVPGEVRARMTLKLLATLGLVDAEEVEALIGADSPLKAEEVLAEMIDLAASDDEARKRMAQPLDLGPPGKQPPGGGDPTDPADPTKKKPIDPTDKKPPVPPPSG